MNHPFKVSDKVVCINNKNILHNAITLKLNEIYVIRECIFCPGDNNPGVKLTGIYNKMHITLKVELSYRIDRFRKLEDIQKENRLKLIKAEPMEVL